MSLDLIESMRENLESMKQFFERNLITTTNEYAQMNLFSLLPNKSVEIRNAKRFFGLNLWLV
jgi:hypothetical protein